MTSPPRPRRPGPATIYAVAEEAGVSIATVSRVLSNPDRVAPGTRERVLAVIDELNYVPHGAARSLAARTHEAYGLVLPELRGPYYAELITGFESAAAERGASVLMLLTHDKQEPDLAVRRLAGRVDAIALMGGAGVTPSTVAAIGGKVPLVQLAGHEVEGVENFSTESTQSARSLTTHLLVDHGRRQLLFVGSPEGSPDVRRRYDGFVQAHADQGLEAADPVDVDLRETGGQDVARSFARGTLTADGLVCANDELALAVMRGLVEAGLDVPGQVAVTGWDDWMAARYVTPGLTSVRQPVRELGRLGAERLSGVLADPDAPEPDHRLSTSVVLRGSCGCG
ncbi:LacI family DNA-binding transcriptional regulator [Ornithinimicrobium sp. LYQ121]|uniref:LacI family DNA-binding transcriptional regulator n=1 Tax=Ornithinimicrobium sp. LYQ121 TaxID=3378801 RepID=UPI003853C888